MEPRRRSLEGSRRNSILRVRDIQVFTSGILGCNSGDCSGLASLQMNRWPINQKRPWPGIPETNPRGAGTNSKSEALAVQLLNFIREPERLATRFLFFFQNATASQAALLNSHRLEELRVLGVL